MATTEKVWLRAPSERESARQRKRVQESERKKINHYAKLDLHTVLASK
jgi:hypothetical protein